MIQHIASSLVLGLLASPQEAPSLGAENASPQEGSSSSPAQEGDAADTAASVWEYLAGRYDENEDGKISSSEYTRGAEQFARLDKDGNGFIEESDTRTADGRRGGGRTGRGREGRGRTAGDRAGGGRAERARLVAPTEGEVAPDFALQSLYSVEEESAAAEAGKTPGKPGERTETKSEPEYRSLKLSDFKGKAPVALIFGSYT